MSYFTEQHNKNMPISNKAKMIQGIKDYIIQKINNNQDIVRLCRYLTKTPLLEIGETYNGELIEQDDINVGLLIPLLDKRDENGVYSELPSIQSRDRILIPYAFDDSLMTQQQLYIFVSNPRTKFSDYYITGEYIFEVIITYSTDYNILEPYGDERVLKILEKFCEDFDDKYNDDKSQEKIGEIKFSIKGFEEVKISTKGTMGRIVRLEAKPITDRWLINNA
ncbi:MAG: hypothetical protein RSA91_01060 [Bacilli bacterium]